MEENLKSKIGFIFFFLIIIGLIVGGYFYRDYLNKSKKPSKKEKIEYKIDNTKDYIYYINESTISENGELYYKDVVINLNTQTNLTESLQKENNIFKNNIKYITADINPGIINYNNDNIEYLTFRDYKDFEFGKYVSLLVSDYNYSCYDAVTFNTSKAYVFDTSTGLLLTSDDLLNMYGINITKVQEKVKTYLEEKQSIIDEVPVINIDETVDSINLNSLYINEFGRLTISYLVKTTQTDYNEITEVN